jgi:hypothetical protein
VLDIDGAADRPTLESKAEIEVTPEMIEAASGACISSEDLYDERARACAGIFAAMLLASNDPLLRQISKVAREGAVVALRPCRIPTTGG